MSSLLEKKYQRGCATLISFLVKLIISNIYFRDEFYKGFMHHYIFSMSILTNYHYIIRRCENFFTINISS